MTAPETMMQPTPTIDMREKRAPTARQPMPSLMCERASTNAGMPPIQIAAPSWCSASTASSGARSESRAIACVVRVAAASTTSPAVSSTRVGARGPLPSNTTASTSAAPILTRLACANSAPSTCPHVRSTVETSTEPCISKVSASPPISARAEKPATRAVPRMIAGPAGRSANGRAAKMRNSVATQSHRLGNDDEAVDDDRQVAEQIDEQAQAQDSRQGAALGGASVNGMSPRVMWPSIASTCQRSE